MGDIDKRVQEIREKLLDIEAQITTTREDSLMDKEKGLLAEIN